MYKNIDLFKDIFVNIINCKNDVFMLLHPDDYTERFLAFASSNRHFIL